MECYSLIIYLLLNKESVILKYLEKCPDTDIIILLLRHFTILGQKNAQNMPRYYTVEQGKNTDWKRSDKMVEQNFNF